MSLLIVWMAWTRPCFAQQPDSASAVAAGALDGRAAAGARSLVGRGIVGFAGGFVTGSTLFLGVVPGWGAVGLAVGAGSALPDSAASAAAAARGAVYASAFEEAYRSRLRGRRRRAALLSGLAGTGIGIFALVVFVAEIEASCASAHAHGSDC